MKIETATFSKRSPLTLPSIVPVIPKKRPEPFDDRDYAYELKYDGFRGILYSIGGRVHLRSRENKSLAFPELIKKLEGSGNKTLLRKRGLILDGEIVSLDSKGRPIFVNLLGRTGDIVFVAFDILWLDGVDLRPKPLLERKGLLGRLSKRTSHLPYLQYASWIRGMGTDLFHLAVANDLEGIVAKRLGSAYDPKRAHWYKVVNEAYSQSKGRPHWNRS
jgi:bifunctional non-homologous end joining protein LigD